MKVDHKKIHEQYKTSTRELPPEYFASHIPDLCETIDRLESIAQETGQLYQPIATELGGGIHFNYVSDSNVEEHFPRMFRLLLNKVRSEGDRKGFNRATDYLEKNKIEPLKVKYNALIDVLETIASGEVLTREQIMNLAENTLHKVSRK